MDVYLSMAEQIEMRNFAVVDNFLEPEIAKALLEESQHLYKAGDFHKANVGKGLEKKARNGSSGRQYLLDGQIRRKGI